MGSTFTWLEKGRHSSHKERGRGLVPYCERDASRCRALVEMRAFWRSQVNFGPTQNLQNDEKGPMVWTEYKGKRVVVTLPAFKVTPRGRARRQLSDEHGSVPIQHKSLFTILSISVLVFFSSYSFLNVYIDNIVSNKYPDFLDPSSGRAVDRGVIQMDQEKIRSVLDWEVPKKERAGSSGEAGCLKQFAFFYDKTAQEE
ncbi:hypothetical protein Tco_0576175 [Tanacetum coccineum]